MIRVPPRTGRPAAVAAFCAAVALLALLPGGASAQGDQTSIGVVCAPDSPATGSATTCTATVTDTAASNPSTPTGQVDFLGPSTGQFGSSGICTLSATTTPDQAACTVTYTPSRGGDNQITADYEGDSSHQPADSQPFDVTPVDATTTAVICDPTTVLLNNSTDCSATVTDSTGHEAILGSVTFSAPSATSTAFTGFSCEPLQQTATGATSTCLVTFTPPAVGAYTVTANYSGDDNHVKSSGSTLVTATGGPPPPTTTTTGPGGTTPPPGSLTIAGGTSVASKGQAPVKVSCVGAAGASCAGTLTLSVRAKVTVPSRPPLTTGKGKSHRKKKHQRPVKRVEFVILGAVTYSFGASHGNTLSIKLSKQAMQLLAAARHHTLTVTATAGQVQQTAVTKTLQLTTKAQKRKKHKHHHK